METVGNAISRIRNQVKASKQDAFLTDRFLYSLLNKHAKVLMRRQDSANKIMKFASVFKALSFVELVEVDKIEAGCSCITGGCTFKRTKDKLPAALEGYWGPLLRAVTSLDQSEKVDITSPSTWEQISKQKTFKYNKTKYYWYLDGYLYFPNLEWDAVRIEGIWDEDISKYNCDTADDCHYAQDREFNVPEFLFAEIEQNVLRELGIAIQIPSDPQQDNRNLLR